jgi:hypothetical protein
MPPTKMSGTVKFWDAERGLTSLPSLMRRIIHVQVFGLRFP